MRRPIDRPTIVTGDTATHAAYGVGPATDYALPRGAWVLAPFDMTLVQYRSGTGGWSLQGTGQARVDFQHLISSSRESGFVREGAPIAQIAGRQDSPGSSWDGEHLHVWVTTKNRRLSFEEYVATLGFVAVPLRGVANPALTSAAGGNTRPITTRRKRPMFTVYRMKGRNDWSRIGETFGVEITTDIATARLWGWQATGDITTPTVELERADYIRAQEQGRKDHERWKATQLELIRQAMSVEVPPAVVDVAAIARAVVDEQHRRLKD